MWLGDFEHGPLVMHEGEACKTQAHLAERPEFRRFLSPLYEIEWVVYAKLPPIDGGPEKILKYLARYVNRVAISNDRLESI